MLNDFKSNLTILFAAMVLLLQSCSLEKQLIKGRNYISRPSRVTHTIEFKDSTFRFTMFGDMQDVSSEGTWKLKNKQIVLQSFDRYKVNYCTVKSDISNCKLKDSIFLTVRDSSGIPLPHVSISAGPAFYLTNQNGEVTFPSSNLEQVKVLFLGSECALATASPGCYVVTFYYDQYSTRYFGNDIWQISNRRIKTSYGKTLYLAK